MFEVSFQLIEFSNKFQNGGFKSKICCVVELFFQHVSSLCIDCSKISKLGGLDKCVNYYFQAANFEAFYSTMR